MPFRSWCFSYVAGRGADDSHRKACGYTGLPRIECDFMFATNRVPTKSWMDHIEHCRLRAPGDGSRSLSGSRNRVLGSICSGHFSRVSEIRGEDYLARGPGGDGDTRAQGGSGEAEAGYFCWNFRQVTVTLPWELWKRPMVLWENRCVRPSMAPR